MARQRILLVLLACLVLAISSGCGGNGGGSGEFNGIPAEMVPNLRPEKASNLSISFEDVGTGTPQRILRLASTISNYGDGPMEIYGAIEGTDHSVIVPATQRIHWNNGAITIEPAGDFEYHDVHHHWHWENLVSFKLAQAVNEADPYDAANTVVGTTPKVSFCLLDTGKIPGFSGPNQPNGKRYQSCGRNTQGISVGWFDIYGAQLYGQWIVIDGLPNGTYWIILETDPENRLRETDETDNRSAVKVQITGNSVSVVP